MERKPIYILSTTYDAFYNEGRLDTLAYYYFLKRVFKRKPIYYNWSWKSLQATTGVSVNALKFHIKILLDKGLVSSKDGHLHILTPKKVGKAKWIVAPYVQGISNLKSVLKSVPVLCSLARQATRICKLDKPDANKHLNRRRNPTMGFTTLSNKTFAKKIDRKSISTVQRRKCRLRELGVIKWRYRYASLKEWGTPNGDPFDHPNRFKIVNNEMCVQLSNHYTLSMFKKKPVEAQYCNHPKVIQGRFR